MASPTGATFDAGLARELHAEGLSCNAIAKRLGVAPSTISRWAAREGLTFDRAQTAAAVKAHTVDLAAARIALAEKMLARSNELLDSLDKPYIVHNFGGRDNTYAEHTLESAPVEVWDKANAGAARTFDRLSRIVEKDTSPAEGAAGVLDMFAAALELAADAIRAEDETPADAG